MRTRVRETANSCVEIRIATTRTTAQLVEGLGAVLLDTDTVAATTELNTKLSPDSE